MKKFGYDLTHGGSKCLSVSTGVQADGTYEFFLHAFGKSGVQRHIHGYAQVTPEGVVIRGGARVKNNVGSYVGPSLVLSHTTQEIARFRVSQTSAGPCCELAQSVNGNWVTTQPSTMGGQIRRREMPLPYDRSDLLAEYSVSMFDARSGVPSNTTDQVLLPFSAPTPFGVLIRTV